MLKIDKTSLFGEYIGPGGVKTVWWRKYRHGTLLILNNHSTKDDIVTFVPKGKVVLLDDPEGPGVCYDIERNIEMFN